MILTGKYERTSAMPKHANGYTLSPEKRKTEKKKKNKYATACH
jgi:hypothetical protein